MLTLLNKHIKIFISVQNFETADAAFIFSGSLQGDR